MKSSFSAAGWERVYKSLDTTHCFMQCAVYTFSLHSIHSTVGHMEKEPESKTPPTTTPALVFSYIK